MEIHQKLKLWLFHVISSLTCLLLRNFTMYNRAKCSTYVNHVDVDFKGYLHCKTIFCNKVAFDVQLIFFIWRKSDVSFSRYLDCVFMRSTDFRIFDIIMALLNNGSYTYDYFFWILSTIKLKFGLVSCMASISDMFLAQINFRLFYDFIEMTI